MENRFHEISTKNGLYEQMVFNIVELSHFQSVSGIPLAKMHFR